jgi:hypothetical protein
MYKSLVKDDQDKLLGSIGFSLAKRQHVYCVPPSAKECIYITPPMVLARAPNEPMIITPKESMCILDPPLERGRKKGLGHGSQCS